jgi:TPR repeat protein
MIAGGLAAASLSGCGSMPDSCRKLSSVRPEIAVNAPFSRRYGDGTDGDRIAHLHCLADRGLPSAQVALAQRYQTGQGVAQDLRRAAGLYERAAAVVPSTTPVYLPPVRLGGTGHVIFLGNPNAGPGSPEAKYHLGQMLIAGSGVKPDVERGEALIHAAAAMGHADALLWLRSRDPR